MISGINKVDYLNESLTTKCKSLNKEPCITRSTLIDLRPDELCLWSVWIKVISYLILLIIHQADYLFQTKNIMKI